MDEPIWTIFLQINKTLCLFSKSAQVYESMHIWRDTSSWEAASEAVL